MSPKYPSIIIYLSYNIYYYNQYLKKFSEAEVISVNQISYIVNRSYITEKDFNGNYIKDDKVWQDKLFKFN